MEDFNENELNQKEIEYCEDDYIGSEEQMGLLAVDEEMKRIKIQENPTSSVSEETKNSNFYKESMVFAETVGSVFQKLLGFGLDYNNALAISSGLVQNDAGSKQLKIQQANQEQNQI
jgi:hypothetical protein